MLKTILSISGKPGLFRLVSQGKNNVIVESLLNGRRIPAYAHDRVISLGDISVYTEEGDTPLREVLEAIQSHYEEAAVPEEILTAPTESLRTTFAEILPSFDREKVYPSDIRKMLKWYNLLLENELTDFSASEEEEGETIPETDIAPEA